MTFKVCEKKLKIASSQLANANSLSGPTGPNANSAVLLLSSGTPKSAEADCASLGEQLWAPELKTANIQPNLDYLTFEGCSADQKYLIAGSRAIDGKGRISKADSNTRLPVLCTQSAPFSNSSFQDASSKWQVSVHSNNEYLTGYVSLNLFSRIFSLLQE
jgi:hypothetical protein